MHSDASIRSGNALVITAGIVALVGTMVVASSEGLVSGLKSAQGSTMQLTALSAVEAVLARREMKIVELAQSGDPQAFVSWNDNYGIDYFGGCEVRWRIEPVRTPPRDGNGNSRNFIANPSPDTSWAPTAGGSDPVTGLPYWQTNDYVYLFKLSGEARLPSGKKDANGDDIPQFRAQSVRYASVNQQPLFRYVLFYAQEGPKGDLEFAHGTDLSILGNVHSNGAIYTGAAPTVNHWGALKPVVGTTSLGPPIGAPPTLPGTDWTAWVNTTSYAISARVQIGTGATAKRYKCTSPHTSNTTTNKPGAGTNWKSYWEVVDKVRVTGVDGIYRLSKPTMFGAFNGFPMNGTAPTAFSGTPVWANIFSTGGSGLRGETGGAKAHYLAPGGPSSTYDGNQINPARLRDGSGLQTRQFTGNDTGIRINGVPLRGVDEGLVLANDARDIDRSATANWTVTSKLAPTGNPAGFEAFARSNDTGGRVVTLPSNLNDRPLEAQAVTSVAKWASGRTYTANVSVVERFGNTYICTSTHVSATANAPREGGSWTSVWTEILGEPHQYAQPRFVVGGNTTTAMPASGNPVVESPGYYIAKALGANRFLTRATDSGGRFIGWSVTDSAGTAITALPDSNGLLIRERPVPNDALYPAHTSASAQIPAGSPSYMPYAYGKHSRPSVWPFQGVDIAGNWYEYPGSNGAVDTAGNAINSTAYGGANAQGGQVLTRVGTSNTTNNVRNGKVRFDDIDDLASREAYVEGGRVTMRSAANPGRAAATGYTDNVSNLNRRPHFYQENWRGVSLVKPEVDTVAGLIATYYDDNYRVGSNGSAEVRYHGPFGGNPAHVRIDTQINHDFSGTSTSTAPFGRPANYNYGWTSTTWPAYSSNTSSGANSLSVRWEGYITVPTAGAWTFSANADDGVRLFIDGQAVIDRRQYNASDIVGTPVTMPSRPVAIVCEVDQQSGGGKCVLKWQGPGVATPTIIPASAFTCRKPSSAAKVRMDTFKAVQARIETFTGPTSGKVGLMLRPTSGYPLVMDGREPYAAVLYSPDRGFYTQVRGQRAASEQATPVTNFVGNGAGTSTIGEIAAAPNTLLRTGFVAARGPIVSGGAPSTNQRIQTYYMPSTAGVTTFGTGAATGSAAILNAMNVYNSPPFAVPEGTVDKVYTGAITLSSYKVPESNTSQTATHVWRFALHMRDNLAAFPALQLFNSTSDVNRAFSLYRDQQATGILPISSATLRTSGSSPIFSFAGNGRWIEGTWSNTASSGWVATAAPTPTLSNTVGSNNTVWYLTSPECRPRVMQGATFVRYLTSAETTQFMADTYGGTWTAITSLPGSSYPAVTNPAQGAAPTVTAPVPTSFTYQATVNLPGTSLGFPNATTIANNSGWIRAGTNTTTPVNNLSFDNDLIRIGASQYVRAIGSTADQNGTNVAMKTLGAAVTSSTTSFTLASIAPPLPYGGDSNAVDGIAVNDTLRFATAAGVEVVRVTAITAANAVTVVRNQTGTTGGASSAGAGTAVFWNGNTTGGGMPVRIDTNARLGAATIASAAAIDLSDFQVGTTSSALATSPADSSADTVQVAGITGSAAIFRVGDVLRLGATGAGLELVKVRAIAGNVLTIQRAMDGSALASVPANTAIFYCMSRTFAVNRARMQTFDVNPYALASTAPMPGLARADLNTPTSFGWAGTNNPYGAASGTGANSNNAWWWTNLRAYLPWSTTAFGSVVPPHTGATLPNMWRFTAATPWSTTPSTNVVPPQTAAAAGTWMSSSLPAFTPTSYPWPGDQGTSGLPTSSSQVWLRVERIDANSDLVRFLYYRGSTTPTSTSWTSIKAADGVTELRMDIRRWFTAGTRLSAGITTTTQTVLAVDSSAGFGIGDIIEVGSGTAIEQMRITGTTATSLTVIRGWGLTTANATVGAGTLVRSLNYKGDVLMPMLVQQSGSATTPIETTFSNLRIETFLAAPDDIIDATDWESGGTTTTSSLASQYLASQYQVFYAGQDITEDFFSFNQSDPSNRLAREDWIFNPREFWSQSRWWDDGRMLEKDLDLNANNDVNDDLTNRTLLGKTTLLTLNLRAIQDYLRTRTLEQAVQKPITNGTVPTGMPTTTLASTFNGLIYAARTNRYPWNPALAGVNPWNPDLPNSDPGQPVVTTTTRSSNYQRMGPTIASFNPASTATTSASPLADWLQPYAIRESPPIMPQDFHHGVRIINGSSIDWGYPSGGTPEFGSSKTTICTPNQLFVQGDLNTTTRVVSYKGATPAKLTPVAVMGDTITFLSNSFVDANFQVDGLSVSGAVVSGTGTLANNQASGSALPVASSTSYYASVLTHNQPTTRSSVRNGEGAAFINTMLYLEDWTGKQFNYLGSMVILDSRRCTRAFLLEAPKAYGPSPFGIMGSTSSPSSTNNWPVVHGISLPEPTTQPSRLWQGNINAVQGPPNRNMDFNYDLLTEEGTPPFTPFGVTASGVGGYTRIVQ